MLLVDSADIRELATALRLPGIGGVTTNPTLVARAAGVESMTAPDYAGRLRSLVDAVQRMALPARRRRDLMIQPAGPVDGIVPLAAQLQSVMDPARWQLWVKLLPEWTSLQLIPELQALGIRTMVTAVYTAAQAEVACHADADAVAVYVGRLITADQNWEQPLSRIAAVARRAQRCVLMASFPDLDTVERAIPYSDSLTIPAALVEALLGSPLSAVAVNAFAGRVR